MDPDSLRQQTQKNLTEKKEKQNGEGTEVKQGVISGAVLRRVASAQPHRRFWSVLESSLVIV